MDNNQQIQVSQNAGEPSVQNVTNPPTYVSQPVNDLGVNEPKIMSGNSVQSPLSGTDVSMTVGQAYGGPIVSTEVEPSVRNETGPYA